MSRGRPVRHRRLLLRALAPLLSLAGLAVLLAGRWRRRRAQRTAAARTPARHPWRCRCGQDYLFSGRGRHRIYWPRALRPDDPVLEQNCPRCGAPLPTGRDVPASAVEPDAVGGTRSPTCFTDTRVISNVARVPSTIAR